MDSLSPPKRWWKRLPARLSVRALMLLILAAACGLGWIVHRARVQRSAVQAILARGGMVEYDYQFGAAKNRSLSTGTTSWPNWLREVLGDDYFHSVVNAGIDRIDGRGTGATDEDLLLFAKLGRLKYLYLGGGRITDDGLGSLKDLTDLQLLVLWGNPIKGDGLERLRNLTNLKHLDLSSTEVTDHRLIGLKHLIGLERLDIPNNRQLNGEFLQYVAGLPRMKNYNLRGSGITDSSLGYLKDAEALMLDRTQVTDAGLYRLKGLSSLKLLDLSQTAVTDSGMASVREWFPLAGVKP